MKKFKLSCVALLILQFTVHGYAETYSEEELRDDILKLIQGQLEFSDNIPRNENELPDTTPTDHSEYDFVVIGAGSAGATIAGRLSEIEDATVLLIEAGPEEYPITDIPALAVPLQFSDEINWRYRTEESDKFCLGFEDHRCSWPRAKIMGGNSVFNFMLATRGNRRDYDRWAELTGDESWSYDKMLHYLKKLENFEVTGVDFDEKLHNTDGPMYISSLPHRSELVEAFIEAGYELGYPKLDLNGAKQAGFAYFQANIKNGERWSSNRGYLHPVKDRKNLVLSRNSLVTKILIDDEMKRAYGVRFLKGDEEIEVTARKEIILSAGAINSPQILMLSGIGPRDHLQDLDIRVIKDAPVGENLMDHVSYGGLVFKINDSSSYNNVGLLDPRNPAIKDYAEDKSGLLGLGIGLEVIAYLDVDNLGTVSEEPSIELMFGTGVGITHPLLSQSMGIKEEYRKKFSEDEFNHSAWTVWPMLMNPKSRGKLTLRSDDPKDKPILEPNYFDHPEDMRILIKSIRSAIELSKTNPLQRYGSQLYDMPLPCDDHEFDSDAFWDCASRTYTCTVYHYAGTCKMGRKNDKTAVVDPELKVIGVEGLRVVDASIMPVIVSAHPHIPIVAIAEKAADMIKRDWHVQPEKKGFIKSCLQMIGL